MIPAQNISPVILGFDGPEITTETESLIHKLRPAAFILFLRNCVDADQLRRLCKDLRRLCPVDNPLIFIDQEGGRVQRLKWQRRFPPAAVFGQMAEKLGLEAALKAAELNYYLIARELNSYGITVNCAPVADLTIKGADQIIGDRAFSHDPKIIGALCAAAIKGMLAGGIWPVIKHAPGHGRAMADSHKELPFVKESLDTLEADFTPFKMNAAAPFVMTAHVAYSALDSKVPATQSSPIIKGLFREKLGLTGLIVADDMFMHALEGTLEERVTHSLKAGCDLVICGSGQINGAFSKEFWPELETLIGKFNLSAEAKQKIIDLPSAPRQFLLSEEEAQRELNSLLKGVYDGF